MADYKPTKNAPIPPTMAITPNCAFCPAPAVGIGGGLVGIVPLPDREVEGTVGTEVGSSGQSVTVEVGSSGVSVGTSVGASVAESVGSAGVEDSGALVGGSGVSVAGGGMTLRVAVAPHSSRDISLGQQPALVQRVPAGQYSVGGKVSHHYY